MSVAVAFMVSVAVESDIVFVLWLAVQVVVVAGSFSVG